MRFKTSSSVSLARGGRSNLELLVEVVCCFFMMRLSTPVSGCQASDAAGSPGSFD